ncbi:hypothetical protein Ahy_A06g028366 [Arachis hypogaea]|uniref:Uncharacterized protein n=1 Tax=Arachis hypogaea TaxID=3818 RepID=A0A445CQZ6_ARAHY|nr:hypothetical protein Ahy_A06g028366 [Arachis hypogaea]
MRKQSYYPICFDAFDDHSDWILENSSPFLTLEEMIFYYYKLFLILICEKYTNVDQLNLEDDQNKDGPSNNAMEYMNATQNQ